MREASEVPIAEWTPFFEQFTVMHRGQEADVEAVGPSNCRPVAVRLPLLRISSDRLPGEAASIDVRTGDSTGTVRQALSDPVRVRVAEWDEGKSAELQLESRDGTAVRVRVGPPAATAMMA
jgi:hypothetical protein